MASRFQNQIAEYQVNLQTEIEQRQKMQVGNLPSFLHNKGISTVDSYVPSLVFLSFFLFPFKNIRFPVSLSSTLAVAYRIFGFCDKPKPRARGHQGITLTLLSLFVLRSMCDPTLLGKL